MNEAILSGRLGKDAEVKQISDRFVYEFTLATDEPKKNQDGTWGKETTWHNIVLWAGTVKLAEMLKQGTQITIRGRISNRQWEKDGVKHYRTEIVTDSWSIDIHLPKREQSQQQQPYQPQPQPVQPYQPQQQPVQPQQQPYQPQPVQQQSYGQTDDGLPF